MTQSSSPSALELEFYSRILRALSVTNDLLVQLGIILIVIAGLLAALFTLQAIRK